MKTKRRAVSRRKAAAAKETCSLGQRTVSIDFVDRLNAATNTVRGIQDAVLGIGITYRAVTGGLYALLDLHWQQLEQLRADVGEVQS
jgi:hypothetical protein